MGCNGKQRQSLSGRRERAQVNKRAKLPERTKKKHERMNSKESAWRTGFCHQTTPLPAAAGQSNTSLLRESAEMKPGTMGLSVEPSEP